MAKKESTKRSAKAQVQQAAPETNPALERLGMLIGKWDMEMSAMSFHPDPHAVAHWRASYEWLEGGIFVVQHQEVIRPDIPHGTWIIGPDDAAGTYCVLYYDSRGVSRIYQMTLGDRVWNVWRDFPGFSQRFSGTFSEDGNTITASWEKSTDGSNWEHDFDLTYRRLT